MYKKYMNNMRIKYHVQCKKYMHNIRSMYNVRRIEHQQQLAYLPEKIVNVKTTRYGILKQKIYKINLTNAYT